MQGMGEEISKKKGNRPRRTATVTIYGRSPRRAGPALLFLFFFFSDSLSLHLLHPLHPCYSLRIIDLRAARALSMPKIPFSACWAFFWYFTKVSLRS